MRATVLLYDGSCGFCSRTVQFILRHDHKKFLMFAALEGRFGTDFRRERAELEDLDSMIWIETEDNRVPVRYDVRSTAALRVARYLGGLWRLALVGWLVPRVARDWVYDRVASHRHLIPGGTECLARDSETRTRFLDP